MLTRGVTLRDIAKQANVSIATVSYVLSGKGRMTPETRRDIERRLRDAGIKPKYKQHAIFYIVDRRGILGEPPDALAYLQTYDGLNTSFHAADLTLRIEFIDTREPRALRKQLSDMLMYSPGAVVIDAHLGESVDLIGRYFEQKHIPAIQIGHTTRSASLDGVVVDNFAGAVKAVQHLVSAGHRRIGTIRWNAKGDPASAKKYAGFTYALSEAGLPLRPEYVVESPYTRVDDAYPGRVAVEKLMSLREPPTAVFVENSFITPDLIHTVHAHERALPAVLRELEMIHFEAWHLEWIEKAMSGKLGFAPRKTKLLRINWQELGRVTAQRVLARLSGAQPSREVIQLVPQLFEVKGVNYKSLEPDPDADVSDS